MNVMFLIAATQIARIRLFAKPMQSDDPRIIEPPTANRFVRARERESIKYELGVGESQGEGCSRLPLEDRRTISTSLCHPSSRHEQMNVSTVARQMTRGLSFECALSLCVCVCARAYIERDGERIRNYSIY